MNSDKRRPGSGKVHPVEAADYMLGTPAVMVMKDKVFGWFSNRLTGCMFTGYPRWGKSTGIRFVSHQLRTVHPGTAVFEYEAGPLGSPYDGPFFEAVLKDFHLAAWNSGSNSIKLTRIINHIYDGAATDPTAMSAVLFIDEAHNLLQPHYGWLVYIHNRLRKLGVYLFTVLVGQPELLEKRAELRLQGKREITARFMARHEPFYGLRHAADIKACLEGYDTRSEFPPDSKISYTRHFCPKGFSKGWRLARHAGAFWREFRRYSKHLKSPEHQVVPMENFCRSVEYVLKNLSRGYNSPAYMQELIEAAVISSGYPESLDDNGDSEP